MSEPGPHSLRKECGQHRHISSVVPELKLILLFLAISYASILLSRGIHNPANPAVGRQGRWSPPHPVLDPCPPQAQPLREGPHCLFVQVMANPDDPIIFPVNIILLPCGYSPLAGLCFLGGGSSSVGQIFDSRSTWGGLP